MSSGLIAACIGQFFSNHRDDGDTLGDQVPILLDNNLIEILWKRIKYH